MPSHSPPSPAADRLIFRPKIGPAGDVLVSIFLKGGMDAVYTIPPFGDRAFQTQRSGFGFAEPAPDGLVNLDDFFGLHPDFAPLESLYRKKLMAVVHAAGLEEPILSHFDAQRSIQRGAAGERTETGWIGRHLAAKDAAASAAGSRAMRMRRRCGLWRWVAAFRWCCKGLWPSRSIRSPIIG